MESRESQLNYPVELLPQQKHIIQNISLTAKPHDQRRRFQTLGYV